MQLGLSQGGIYETSKAHSRVVRLASGCCECVWCGGERGGGREGGEGGHGDQGRVPGLLNHPEQLVLDCDLPVIRAHGKCNLEEGKSEHMLLTIRFHISDANIECICNVS